MDFDLAIAGGGPVGLATAIYARQRGLSAIVFDRRGVPREKACGEGIMPRGRAALRELGVELPVDEVAAFVGIRFIDGACVAEGRFAAGAGLGVPRATLWSALAARAAQAGVELAFGEAVGEWCASPTSVQVCTTRRRVRARLLVGADGLHSRVRKGAGLEKRSRATPRYGMRQHFHLEPWSPFVEVYWSDGGEAYVTPVGPSTVGVALLWRGDGCSFSETIERFPELRGRLAGAASLDRVRGAGPFAQRVGLRVAPGVALVGDAAGYVDPLTGEGLTLGFESARALVDTFARSASPMAYERAYRRLSRTHVLVTRALLMIAAHPPLRRRLNRELAHNRVLFESLLAINSGERTWRGLGLSAAVRALGAVLP